jgi:hypothetical protein
MARKKHRDIVVDGENWAWAFNAARDSDGYRYGDQSLKIWHDKKIAFEKSYGYCCGPKKKKYKIRPSLIARFIKTYLKK